MVRSKPELWNPRSWETSWRPWQFQAAYTSEEYQNRQPGLLWHLGVRQVQRKLHFHKFFRNLGSQSLSTKGAISLITGRRDKWLSVVTISTPKCMLAYRFPPYQKYLAFLTSSLTLNFSSSWTSISLAAHFSLGFCRVLLVFYAFSWSSLCLQLSPLLSQLPASLLNLVQPAGRVQSTTFSLCSGLSQMALATLSLISITKAFLSTLPGSDHVISFFLR